MSKRFIFILILGLFLVNVGYSQINNTLIDCFYKITDKWGKEIGYVHYVLKESMWQDIPCYEIIKEDEYSIKRLFFKSKMEGREKAYIGKDGGILYFERMETHYTFTPKTKVKVNYIGIREKDKMLMTERLEEFVYEYKGEEFKKELTEEERGERREEIDLSKIDCTIYDFDLPVMKQIINLSVGEKRELRIFDPQFSVIREGLLEVKEKTKINLAGKEYEAYQIKGKIDEERIDFWVTTDGKLLLKRRDSEGEMILQPAGRK